MERAQLPKKCVLSSALVLMPCIFNLANEKVAGLETLLQLLLCNVTFSVFKVKNFE